MRTRNVKLKTVDRQRSPLLPFVMIPKVFFTRYQPSYKAILTFVALKYYASNEAAACEGMSIKTLAARVAISESTLIRGMAELTRKGVVRALKRSRKSKDRARIPLPNLYELADLQEIGGEPI